MTDHISELFSGQELIDESTLPDNTAPDVDADTEAPASHDAPAGDDGLDLVPEGEQPPARTKHVPLAALQEERTRRQELQDELRQQRELQERMQERFNEMMQRMQPQQPTPQEKPVEIPPFIEDPEGHINALREQLTRELEQVKQFQQMQYDQQQAAVQGQGLARQVSVAEEEFKKVTPDYQDAANYFAQRKRAEYAAFGLDPVTIDAQIKRDYQGIAIAAQQNRKNPAAVLYEISKALGYTAQQQQQQPAARPAGAPPAKPAPTSLSTAPGAPRAPDEQGGITMEAIANMTDAEFDKYWAQMERSSKQRPKF